MFLEGLLQPCLERGRLSALQGLLEKLDPTLEACSRYLIASCQFLQRRRYFNTLYQFQQFMMVRNVFIVNNVLFLDIPRLGQPCVFIFALTGSRARCHDLYQVLHP